MNNRLFVAHKKRGVSSNFFLKELKRRYKVKKAGYSGTLDPFAEGVLIVAFGQYTKLFNYLKKSPKTYKATLHLGAFSPTLDNEKIESIKEIDSFDISFIEQTIRLFLGKVEYFPPKYSAKSINGKRAYELARENKEFELKKIQSTIFDLKLIEYHHPFVTFEITISEGGYVRSVAQMIANKLGVDGTLTSLIRLKEGDFFYENEKSLNPLDFLNIKQNSYLGDYSDIFLGKKLTLDQFSIKEDGIYYLLKNSFLSVIEIKDKEVKYRLNQIRMQGC